MLNMVIKAVKIAKVYTQVVLNLFSIQFLLKRAHIVATYYSLVNLE